MRHRLEAMGYRVLRTMPNDEIAGVAKFIFTYGLVTGLTRDSYRARYCYENLQDACKALTKWDGDGDPSGPWIKLKAFGKNDRLGPGAH